MKFNSFFKFSVLLPVALTAAEKNESPNVIMIYTDDVGYGDLSCYGNSRIQTPHIDRIANTGVRFTDAHSTAATSTPSRYALMTGRYPWRVQGTDVLPGDGALLISPAELTLPKVFQQSGYTTAVVGKWHLGLGLKSGMQDWNGQIAPGPRETGFDYSFIIPATGDRVPCVFMENQVVVNSDPSDPIEIDYKKPFQGITVAKGHPELLKLQSSRGHDQAIVNGIGRIGYMKGGKNALWDDETIAFTLVSKAQDFIRANKEKPFFLYLSTHDIHVPRVPNAMFAGKSGMGARGDVILQLDWTVGQIYELLDKLHLTENTILLFSSDNGGVADDGYQDGAEEGVKGHHISGPFRGFKGATWEGGTRVPTMLSWPSEVKSGVVSNAQLMQVDLLASFASLLNYKLPNDNSAPDSFNMLKSWLGKSRSNREYLIENNHTHTFSIIRGNWKYIEPSAPSVKVSDYYGNTPVHKLFNLKVDIGETTNLYEKEKNKASKLIDVLKKAQSVVRTRK